MKQSPEYRRIVANMAPGVLSLDGFLGHDTRDLTEILDADGRTVDQLGLTHEKIASRLYAISQAAENAFGAPVEVGRSLRAVFVEARGEIPCPWSDGDHRPKGEVELTDTATGRVWHFTPLSIHLIAKHGFYDGRGSRYRLEPGEIAKVLGLVS